MEDDSIVLSSLRINHNQPVRKDACPQAGCKFRGTAQEVRSHLGVSDLMPISEWKNYVTKYPHTPVTND